MSLRKRVELGLRTLDAILVGIGWSVLVLGPRVITELVCPPTLPPGPDALFLLGGTLLQVCAFRAGISSRVVLGKARPFAKPLPSSAYRARLSTRPIVPNFKKPDAVEVIIALVGGVFALINLAGLGGLFMLLACCFLMPPVWFTVEAIIGCWALKYWGPRFYEYHPETGTFSLLTKLLGLEDRTLLANDADSLTIRDWNVLTIVTRRGTEISVPCCSGLSNEEAVRAARSVSKQLDIAFTDKGSSPPSDRPSAMLRPPPLPPQA